MNTAVDMQARSLPTRARPFYARVAALGFGVIALTGVIALITSLSAGETGEGWALALIFLVVGLLVAAALWTSGTWARILAIVLSLLLLALVVPFSTFALAHPESATEFVPIVIMLMGAALGLIGSIVAIVQSRRKTMQDHASGTERTVLATLMGVLAVAALFSVILTLTSRTPVSAQARAGATSMGIKNFAFSPAIWKVRPGESIRVVIKNDDTNMHTFTLPAAGIDVAVAPGAEKLVEFTAPTAGIYGWYCIPHSAETDGIRQGMTGSLVVE